MAGRTAWRRHVRDPISRQTAVTYPLADRTPEEGKAFGYAMWDMGRLYASTSAR